jgi:hypothetical protein
VSFELTARADKVHLVVIHRLLPSRDDMVSVAGGWHAHLDILADRLNGRAPGAFLVHAHPPRGAVRAKDPE